MDPSEVSAKLNQIATAIESSENPRPDLVAQDISLLADIIAGKKKKKSKKKDDKKCECKKCKCDPCECDKKKGKKASMKPSEVSAVLNKIATAIENSQNPRADLVIEDLKRVITAVGPGEYVIVAITGDSSYINVDRTDLVPPDGKYMDIDLPNSDDVVFVVDPALLQDQQFIADHIPEHLVGDLQGVI